MAYRALIPEDVAESGKTYLRERGYTIKMGSGTTIDILKREVANCGAVFIRIARLPAEVWCGGKKLEVIARHGVGVDNIDLEVAAKLGIVVTNAPESNSESVAEHTLGLILALSKNLVAKDREFRAGNFEIRNNLLGIDLKNKVLGVIGLGKIGTKVARKARLGLEMHVIGFDPYLSPDRVPSEVERLVEWEELFATSDIITLHLPANERTRGLIGNSELKMMKPTAYLINTARGEIIKSLRSMSWSRLSRINGLLEQLWMYFWEEPPRKSHPLLAMDNVIVSPHCTALTRECTNSMSLHAAIGIDQVLSGNEISWPVKLPDVPGELYRSTE